MAIFFIRLRRKEIECRMGFATFFIVHSRGTRSVFIFNAKIIQHVIRNISGYLSWSKYDNTQNSIFRRTRTTLK